MPKHAESQRRPRLEVLPHSGYGEHVRGQHRGAEAVGGQRKELTTSETAVLLGVTPARVRQFIGEGRLPARRFGRDWLIRKIDAERFASQPRRRTGRRSKSLRIRKDFARVRP